MDRSRRPGYQSLGDVDEEGHAHAAVATPEDEALLGRDSAQEDEVPFSWLEYGIFCFVGVAMLWAWNMFLAAAPYFASRFTGDAWIEANFQSAILTVSTLTNLATVLALSHIQSSASYPFRINIALVINTAIFTLLTISTSTFLDATPAQYLVFVLVMVGTTSLATGFLQNGGYAFAASFRRPEYMQAIMAGQGVAGVLPSIAQVISVLIFPPGSGKTEDSEPAAQGSTSAFIYFLAAVVISLATLIALIPLVRRHKVITESRLVDRLASSLTSLEEAERAGRKVVSLVHLFRKLPSLSLGIVATFTVTMFFPVFTAKILSVRTDAGTLFEPAAFIPLGFLFWNLGDLAGRIATILPFSLADRPVLLLVLACARGALIPLYLLCNIGGRGALVPSDFFYLFVVQLAIGTSNGWIGSSIMMAAGDWVDDDEREATGGYMGFCLVVGLAVGSLLSFTASGI